MAAAACLPAARALAGPPVFVVTGGGFGHGVGMSQYGAEGFALHGYRYQSILAHYYPGTSLGHVDESDVRVLLASGGTQVLIGSDRPFRVTDGRDLRVVLPAGRYQVGHPFTVHLRGKRHRRTRLQLRLPFSFQPGAAPLTLAGSAYRGTLTVTGGSDGLEVVNTVAMDMYLRGVVPAEMPSRWLQQALEAQAVAARSYALASLRPGSSFDLYRDTRSQMYGGVDAERPSTDAAVAATSGRVLLWHGQVARTYYYSSSGGRTAANVDAWPGMAPLPYLRSVGDPYDTISPYHRWRPLVLGGAEMGRRLGIGGLRDLQAEAAPSGWVRAVQVRTSGGERSLSAETFARSLGLRSTDFRIGVLQLQTAAGITVYGRRVALSGLTRGLRPVLESRQPGGSWRSAPLPAPGRDGRAWVLVRPTRTTLYRLAATGVVTAPVQIDVAPSLVVIGSHRRLSGRVEPAIGGFRVAIQRLLAGNWLTIRSATLLPAGVFSLSRTLPAGVYRARTMPTARLLAGASVPIRLR